MNCKEFRERVAAYAVGSLDGAEAAACKAHLNEKIAHEGCAEALHKAQATAAKLGLVLKPVRPTEQVWKSIERRIGLVDVADVPRAHLARQLGSWALAAVLAGLLLYTHQQSIALEDHARNNWRSLTKLRSYANDSDRAVEAAVARAQAAEHTLAQQQLADGERKQCSVLVERVRQHLTLQREAIAMLRRPGAMAVSLHGKEGGSAQATLFYDPATHRAIVLAHGIAQPRGTAVQLWLLRGEAAAVPAGFLIPVIDGVAIGEVDSRLLAAAGADRVALSLEPAGGQKAPGELLLVGGLLEHTVQTQDR